MTLPISPSSDTQDTASKAKTRWPQASWTDADEENLMAYLVEHKSEGGDGGNFKKPTWVKAAAHANQTITKGAAKTSDSCGGRCGALKSVFEIVRAIRDNSGWSWDDKRGAGITVEKTGTWDDFVAKNCGAAPFRNAGWVHLGAFDLIVTSAVKGTQVYRGNTLEANENKHLDEGVSQDTTVEQVEEEDHDDKEASQTPVTPAPTRKCTTAAPVSQSDKRLADVNQTMKSFNTIFASAFALSSSGIDATPKQKEKAIMQAQELEAEWLSDDDLVDFIMLLEKDREVVNACNSLKSESI
ncbi:hypothetical protein H0H93_009626 [Arthromyces matolae]|nr:hypothetical protein H0H93_009626 [Arthromyces matolae]